MSRTLAVGVATMVKTRDCIAKQAITKAGAIKVGTSIKMAVVAAQGCLADSKVTRYSQAEH
jgi:hypothetical protein